MTLVAALIFAVAAQGGPHGGGPRLSNEVSIDHTRPTAVAFRQDGKLLALAGTGWADVWSVAKSRRLITATFPGGSASCLSFDESSKLCIWGAIPSVLDLSTGKIKPMKGPVPTAPDNEVQAVSGSRLLVNSSDGFSIVDLKAHRRIGIPQGSGFQGPVLWPARNAIITPEGNAICVRRMSDMKLLASIKPPLQPSELADYCCGDAKGNEILAVTSYGGLVVWRLGHGIKRFVEPRMFSTFPAMAKTAIDASGSWAFIHSDDRLFVVRLSDGKVKAVIGSLSTGDLAYCPTAHVILDTNPAQITLLNENLDVAKRLSQ